MSFSNDSGFETARNATFPFEATDSRAVLPLFNANFSGTKISPTETVGLIVILQNRR